MEPYIHFDKTKAYDEFYAELQERYAADGLQEEFALVVHELKVHMVPFEIWPAIFEFIEDSTREKMKDYDASDGDVVSYMRPYVKKAIFEEKNTGLQARFHQI